MKEEYSINEILNAIDDLQNSKKEKKIDKIVINKPVPKNRSDDIPLNSDKNQKLHLAQCWDLNCGITHTI